MGRGRRGGSIKLFAFVRLLDKRTNIDCSKPAKCHARESWRKADYRTSQRRAGCGYDKCENRRIVTRCLAATFGASAVCAREREEAPP